MTPRTNSSTTCMPHQFWQDWQWLQILNMFGCEFYSITTTRLCPSEYIMIDTLIHISISHLLTFCCKLIVSRFVKPLSTSSQLWLKYLLFRWCISLQNNIIFLIRTLFTRMTNDAEIIKLCHENHLKEMWVHVDNTDPIHKTQLDMWLKTERSNGITQWDL